MHEDSMDSKSLRPNGASSENKNSKSDSTPLAGKVQNRNGGKKRENACVVPWNGIPPGATATGASTVGFKGQQQKPWIPKSKGMDKRQKSKTGYGSSRKNDYQVTDSNDPDLDSLVSDKGKKQNLTHMLNMKFQLTPRDTLVSPYWRATHSTGVGDNKGGRRLYNHSYSSRGYLNKDHYLQANCQFVVKADGDYTVYLTDPDLLVPWESIEQIRIWGSQIAMCPICLHPPVAARISRCGHIYCWPCILHFLALSDKPSRPCPICDAPIRIQDLKSVVALEQRQLKVGDMLEMRLMKRDRHSLEPQPVIRSGVQESTVRQQPRQEPMHLSKAGENHVFSKLLTVTPREVIDLILNWEKTELKLQYEAEKDCPEACFIQQALELLAVRESILEVAESHSSDVVEAFGAMSLVEEVPEAGAVAVDFDSASDSVDFSRSRYTSYSSEGMLPEDTEVTSSTCLSPPPSASYRSHQPLKQQQKNVFYFYQSSDGQAVYLHPLNVQMLVQCYGSLEHCPETINGRIVEVDTLFMNEDLRHRLRYLGHISISKQFQIIEIVLTEPFVDTIILEEFRERIEERERRRRRKDREERRRDIEIQKAEDAKWGRSKSQPIVRLDSQIHFPEFSSPTETDPPLVAAAASPPQADLMTEQHGPSFAQMLREGKNKMPAASAWPSTLSARAAVESTHPIRKRTTSEENPEEYNPAPEYKDTFSSALAAAFDLASNSFAGETNRDEHRPNKKGKKKTKQKLLFSTGMNFM